MKVSDIMTSHVCTVSPDLTVENAAKLMNGADIGVLPVCDGDGLRGVVTDRDIVTRCVSAGHKSDMEVGEIMTSDVFFINGNATIEEASRLMSRHQIRRLPVVEGREIVGIVTMGDIARCGVLDNVVAKTEQAITQV